MMRLVPEKQALRAMLAVAAGKSSASGVVLFTFKKDRSLALYRQTETLALIEAGYTQAKQTFPVTASGPCRHAVRTAFKREFPRSHEVYLTQNE